MSCTLAQKDKGEPYAVEITLAPKVKFNDGKAIEASINWGDASAPLLVYPLIYAGTGLRQSDQRPRARGCALVNAFATRKCAEVKAELRPAPIRRINRGGICQATPARASSGPSCPVSIRRNMRISHWNDHVGCETIAGRFRSTTKCPAQANR